MDNLRSVVSAIDSRLSWYLGVKMFYHPYKLAYHSGGAGHVLSRMALKKMVEEGTKNKTACPFGGVTTLTFEDVMTGLCLRYVGIQPTEVMDGPKRAFNAFHPLTAPGKNKPIITLKVKYTCVIPLSYQWHMCVISLTCVIPVTYLFHTVILPVSHRYLTCFT